MSTRKSIFALAALVALGALAFAPTSASAFGYGGGGGMGRGGLGGGMGHVDGIGRGTVAGGYLGFNRGIGGGHLAFDHFGRRGRNLSGGPQHNGMWHKVCVRTAPSGGWARKCVLWEWEP